MIKNFLTDTIHRIRPDQPVEYQFTESENEDPVRIVPNRSPRWQNTTKQYIVVTLLVLIGISLFFLRNMIGPLIFALILTYLNHPLVSFLHRKTGLSWKLSVSVIYIAIVLGIIGFLAWGGIALYSQAENMVAFLLESIENFPETLNELLQANENVSPFVAQFNDLSNSALGTQLSEALQGLLRNLGGGLATLAQGAISKLGWLFFILGISFFILLESKGIAVGSVKFPIEGYEFDFLMAKQQFSRIWNSFLRGQVILMVFTIWLYTVVFSILSLRYSLILALLVGLARLIPYVGSTVAFAAYAFVAFFQGSSIFGLDQGTYAAVIVLIAFVIDKVMDGFLTPKVMADTLMIHPALVLIFAIICSRMFGFIGILIAAPVVASLKLILNYILRKLRDQDPWEGMPTVPHSTPLSDMIGMYYRKSRKTISVISFKIMRKLEALGRYIKRLYIKKDSGSAGT